MDQADFRAAWDAEPMLTRRRIMDAVADGEPMPDAEDAALAAAYARDLKRQQTIAGRVMFGMMIVVIAAVIGAPEQVPSWPRILTFVLVIGLGVTQFFRRHRYDDIGAANEAVVHSYWAERRPPPPAQGTIADAVDEWRQRTVGEGE